jgi:rhamnose utilization protein RhaD (predicted bifunctional aldolase and dehydrogenase)/NAD(P)-dependent dehydrogenase (short-subunit alcohol dehydrogenase family)
MVANKWQDAEAEKYAAQAGGDLADRQLALQIYASRLIGSDPDLVLHGGGNTSCKVTRKDLFGADQDILHVKGSGHDLASIDAGQMPAIRLASIRALRALENLSDESMVNTLRSAMVDASGPYPSIETLLHAFLPHAFVNHTHATAMLVLADLPDAEAVVAEIFGGTVDTVPFYKPGFDLGIAASEVYEANPEVEGLILLNHGHFAFADNPKDAYERIIRHTNLALDWMQTKSGKALLTAGGPKRENADGASEILPALRGRIGKELASFTGNRDAAMPVADIRAGPNVEAFLTRSDLATLARRGIATPDHVIRTKNYPLYLPKDMQSPEAVAQSVGDYVQAYTRYFDENAARSSEAKTMLAPIPDVAWIESVGIVGMGRDARAARIAADLAEQNIATMDMAEDCGGFYPVDEARLFDMEYWSLEQAKLGKSTPPAFSGRVVLITGGAGAIGLATAQAFAALGANIFLVDLSPDALADALAVLGLDHDGLAMDITAEGAATVATAACATRFGGLDILVSNAGAAWTGEMDSLDDSLLRKSFELNFFAHQAFSKAAAGVFATQGRGGQILFNVSKQAVNPGKGFGAYGLPKATTMFLLRQLALELGPKGIRVNGINADRIRSGLLDDAFISERSKARGIDEGTYMAGNLLHREVEACHVANAFVALAQSERTTAHVMTVDGGNIEAALR